MIKLDNLCISHYCHPSCVPYMNICRLSKGEAFSLASQMAEDNPSNSSFSRFAEFEGYYDRRMKVDAQLYNMFVSLGGKPQEIYSRR